MRDRIIGAIGVMWGGFVLVSTLLRGPTAGLGASRFAGLGLAVLFVVIGGYFLIRGGRKAS